MGELILNSEVSISLSSWIEKRRSEFEGLEWGWLVAILNTNLGAEGQAPER